jgi:hypothetical protein
MLQRLSGLHETLDRLKCERPFSNFVCLRQALYKSPPAGSVNSPWRAPTHRRALRGGRYEGIVSGGESLAEAGSSFAPYSPSSPSGGADGFLPRGGAGAERWAPPPPIMNPDVTIYSAALQQVSPAPPPPPSSRTNRTRLAPPSVLSGHVSSLLPY